MDLSKPVIFESLPNPQHASRLFQLPTEVRLMILSMLHKHNGRIPVLGEHPTDPGVGTNLSAQLLRVCQILYRESIDILYSNETVTVRFKLNSNCEKTIDVEILDSIAHFHSSSWVYVDRGCRGNRLESKDMCDSYTISLPTLDPFMKLAKFRHIYVIIIHDDGRLVLGFVSHAFQQYTIDKHVTVESQPISCRTEPSQSACIVSHRMPILHPLRDNNFFHRSRSRSLRYFGPQCIRDCCLLSAVSVLYSTMGRYSYAVVMWAAVFLKNLATKIPGFSAIIHDHYDRSFLEHLHEAIRNENTQLLEQIQENFVERAVSDLEQSKDVVANKCEHEREREKILVVDDPPASGPFNVKRILRRLTAQINHKKTQRPVRYLNILQVIDMQIDERLELIKNFHNSGLQQWICRQQRAGLCVNRR